MHWDLKFEVLIVLAMNNNVVCDAALCGLGDICQYSGRTCYLYFEGNPLKIGALSPYQILVNI